MSTDSATDDSERSSAESRVTFLSPPPVTDQGRNIHSSESDSDSESGEEDMVKADSDSESGEEDMVNADSDSESGEEDMVNAEDEGEEGETEEEGEGEGEGEEGETEEEGEGEGEGEEGETEEEGEGEGEGEEGETEEEGEGEGEGEEGETEEEGEGEGEIEMECEDGPKSKESPALNESAIVVNATGQRKGRELYPESDFAMGVMLESPMYQRRSVFQGLVNRIELPPLSEDKVNELKRKWRALRIRELEVDLERIAWWQECSKMWIEELKRERDNY